MKGSAARLAEYAGFAVVAVFLIGMFFAPPTDFFVRGITAPELAGLYREHRTIVLTSIYLGSATWGALFLVFCGALSRFMAEASDDAAPYASIGLIGGAVESAMILLFCAFTNLAAYVASGVGPTDVLLLHFGALLANNLSGFPTIVCVGAYTLGGRRAGIFPKWVTALAWLCVGMHATSTASVAAAGALSPAGLASLTAPFTMVAWVLGVSVALRTRAGVSGEIA